MFCTICLGNITVAEIMTSCQHTYHKKCLDIWLTKSVECPVCRQTMTYELIGPQTRSRTERIRGRRAMTRIIFLFDLFDITFHKGERKRIIKKILKIACQHRDALRRHKDFWKDLRLFGKTIADGDTEGYYKNVMNCWDIQILTDKI